MAAHAVVWYGIVWPRGMYLYGIIIILSYNCRVILILIVCRGFLCCSCWELETIRDLMRSRLTWIHSQYSLVWRATTEPPTKRWNEGEPTANSKTTSLFTTALSRGVLLECSFL
jgi:hypothetical protein